MSPIPGLPVPFSGGGEEGGAPTFGEHNFESIKLFPDVAGLSWFTNHHALAIIGALITIVFWIVVSRNLKVVPGKRQFLGEFMYGMIRNGVARDIFGHDFGRYKSLMVPWLLTLFTFILVNNLFGQFFFMFPTFSKVGFPYVLAALTFILYNAAGIAKWGPRYFVNMTVPKGVPWVLLPLVIPLEILSNFIVRPVSLALRLFANLFAGHLVVLVFVVGGGWLLSQAGNVVYQVAGGASLVFSLAIFALELLVAFIQAYIFTVLTAQYVASAVAEEH